MRLEFGEVVCGCHIFSHNAAPFLHIIIQKKQVQECSLLCVIKDYVREDNCASSFPEDDVNDLNAEIVQLLDFVIFHGKAVSSLRAS